MEEQSCLKVNTIVEYVKTKDEFPFDALDVEDDLEVVLSYFGLHPELDDQERDEIRRGLLPRALSAEIAEISRTLFLMEQAAPLDLPLDAERFLEVCSE